MASHHHHHGCVRRHNHHDNIPLVATSSRCCHYSDSSPCCTQSNHPSPPLPHDLLNLVASYLQNQQQETQCPDYSFNFMRRKQNQKNVPREYDHIVLSSLLRKIDDLESSLNDFSACYDQRRDRYSSLRDSAARVIQTHFRSYLVHRSISFRYLKELATIKSSFVSLKSSVSGKPHFPFNSVSRKATDLLLQLDSIQGRIDPMIRNSKRSLSRDLVRFLQYIDDCAVKRYDFLTKSAINVSFKDSPGKLRGSDSRKPHDFGVAEDRSHKKVEKSRNPMGKVYVTSGEDEDSNAELEELYFMTDDGEKVPMSYIDKRKIGNLVKPPVKKSMVFDKNKNVYLLHGDTHDSNSSAEDVSVDDDKEETLVKSKDNARKPSLNTRILVKGNGGKPRVVKTVSFDENGNIYKVFEDTPESSISEEDDSTSGSNNEVEEIKYVPKETEVFDEGGEEEIQSENEVSSSEGSEEDTIVKRNDNHPLSNEQKKELQHQKGSSMFYPPLPLKMEP